MLNVLRLDHLTSLARHAWCKFARNRRGVAAIEFAMVVPIMVTLFIGIVEFSQAITVDRRVNQVASSTADLIARSKKTTTTELAGIMDIIDELLKPYDAAPIRLTATNVIASTTDATKTVVCWSYHHPNGGVESYKNGADYQLPTGILEKGESVMVVKAEYAYTPALFSKFIKGTITFSDTFYLKPRLSSSIEYDGVKCTPPQP